jgi:hypothetical protein
MVGRPDEAAEMSLEQLRRLVADAEQQPGLRALLRQAGPAARPARGQRPWGHLIERARTLGYAINWADLEQACSAEEAARFLSQARIEPVADLMGSVPGRRAQLSSRRLASTSR